MPHYNLHKDSTYFRVLIEGFNGGAFNTTRALNKE